MSLNNQLPGREPSRNRALAETASLSGHPQRRGSCPRVLLWKPSQLAGVAGWGEEGTPHRCGTKAKHGSLCRLLHVNCPELGLVSRSPSILHRETPPDPKKNTGSTKCQQREMRCAFSSFMLQLFLAPLTTEITSAMPGAYEVINKLSPRRSPAFTLLCSTSSPEKFMTVCPPTQ